MGEEGAAGGTFECPVCIMTKPLASRHIVHTTVNGIDHAFCLECVVEWLDTRLRDLNPFICPLCNRVERDLDSIVNTGLRSQDPAIRNAAVGLASKCVMIIQDYAVRRAAAGAADHVVLDVAPRPVAGADLARIPIERWPEITIGLSTGIAVFLDRVLVRILFTLRSDIDDLRTRHMGLSRVSHPAARRGVEELQHRIDNTADSIGVTEALWYFIACMYLIVTAASIYDIANRPPRRRGGGKELYVYINDKIYPIPPHMEGIFTYLLSSLKNELEKRSPPKLKKEGGSKKTQKRPRFKLAR
jgi:hypothetical protein